MRFKSRFLKIIISPDRNCWRAIRFNWDPEMQTTNFDPELELNPNRNAWRLYIDTGYYGGKLKGVLLSFWVLFPESRDLCSMVF